jgi:DNA modification methylase
MMPYYDTAGITIYHGDCREVLPGLRADVIVTDPPYGLEFMGKEWDKPHRLLDKRDARAENLPVRPKGGNNPFIASRVTYRAGAAYQAWTEQWAALALDALPPGGWLLAFGGTRTWHRLACGLEDAGFELRDTIAEFGPGGDAAEAAYGPLAWVYGSGFPSSKSLDVSKAIDAKQLTGKTNSAGIAAAQDTRPPDPAGDPYATRRNQTGSAMGRDRDIAAGYKTEATGYRGRSYQPTDPLTPEAERWQGWGTSLKPSWEPVIVARKPLSGTVAQNVLTHGTGALNIDACRVESGARPHIENAGGQEKAAAFGSGKYGSRSLGETTTGRWPANVVLTHVGPSEHGEGCQPVGTRKVKGANVPGPQGRTSGDFGKNGVYGQAAGRHDEMRLYTDPDGTETVQAWDCSAEPDCPVALLDQQSGELESGKPGVMRAGVNRGAAYGAESRKPGTPMVGFGDRGGASRFYYTAKASRAERITVDGESHPTVKPLALMRWLVRLVTPPGGTVLDPFCGSGSTLVAAAMEGFRAIGIEADERWCRGSAQRVAERPAVQEVLAL